MSNLRYGVFLRPDPATCWAVTQITTALRAQFGLLSSGAFPPHVTLAGNVLVDDGTGREALLEAIGTALTGRPAVVLNTSGVRRVADAWLMDVDADGPRRNAALCALAGAVIEAVLPLALPREDYLTGPLSVGDFWAHISLASHDLVVDPSLSEEVGAFIAGLPITVPTRSLADTVSLFAFEAEDWHGQWWRAMSWRHVRSWALQPG